MAAAQNTSLLTSSAMASPPNAPSISHFSHPFLPEFDGSFPWHPSSDSSPPFLPSTQKSIKPHPFAFPPDSPSLPSGHHHSLDATPSPALGSFHKAANWEVGFDQQPSFSSILSASTGPLPSSTMIANAHEGPALRELAARLGSKLSNSSAVPLGSSCREKMLNLSGSTCWSSMNGASNSILAVDPSKGGIQGVNLAASHYLANFSSDPGFVERAARYSSFNNQTYSELAPPFILPPAEGTKSYPRSSPHPFDKLKITRVPSSPTLRKSTPNSPSGTPAASGGDLQDPNTATPGIPGGRTSCASSLVESAEVIQKPMNESDVSVGQEESSSCEQGLVTGNVGKKRKLGFKDRSKGASCVRATPAGQDSKYVDADEAEGKRYRIADNANLEKEEQQKSKVEQSNSGNSEDSIPKSVKESSKPPEPPKPDYIHVRARRGQATDSHSLAERVRREKISERMKFLQDLVPGCSKVTGKAVMLDEIINYVQSLQRQVEFLSMKLAAVNPRLELNIDSFLSNNEMMIQHRAGGVVQSMLFAPESSNAHQIPPLPQQQQPPAQASNLQDIHPPPAAPEPPLRRAVAAPMPSMDHAIYGDSLSQQQLAQAWEDELQSIVQMGFGQGQQQAPLALQAGRLPATSHMKIEL